MKRTSAEWACIIAHRLETATDDEVATIDCNDVQTTKVPNHVKVNAGSKALVAMGKVDPLASTLRWLKGSPSTPDDCLRKQFVAIIDAVRESLPAMTHEQENVVLRLIEAGYIFHGTVVWREEQEAAALKLIQDAEQSRSGGPVKTIMANEHHEAIRAKWRLTRESGPVEMGAFVRACSIDKKCGKPCKSTVYDATKELRRKDKAATKKAKAQRRQSPR